MKTADFVRNRVIMGIWPQAVLEPLLVNYMADRNKERSFIPVFAGDFNEHLVLHAFPTQGDFMLHAATQVKPKGPELAVRYIRYVLEESKDAAIASLQGDLSLPVELPC